MDDRPNGRIIGIAAISGAILLFAGTYFHPMSADPNVAAAAFAEYAAAHYWVAIHLTQLAGVALMIGALLMLSEGLEDQRQRRLVIAIRAGAIVSLGLAAALQAVDGVALKRLIDAWATAGEAEKVDLFVGAFAVRQIEIGLASLTSLSFGLTVALFGAALMIDRRFSGWLGVIAIAGGVPLAVSGVVMAHQGFSAAATALNLPASVLLLLWMIALGAYAWRGAATA